MSCKDKNCCSMIDELLEEIQAGLGRVDYDRIDEYIDEKIAGLEEALIDGDIKVNVDMEEVLRRVKDFIANCDDLIDAYAVTYKDSNVGEKLDELLEVFEGFEITIKNSLRDFTKGEVVYNTPIYFEFNKPLKSLTASIYINDMNTSTVNLDPTAKKFDIPRLSEDTQIVIKGVSEDNEVAEGTWYAHFYLKYYVGCSGATSMTNREVTALNSYHAHSGVSKYSYIFHPIGKQYLWWAFPVDLHTDYDFFNNGFMDSNYVWTTGNLTNEYGYTSTYLFIRSINPHTASNIYTEVRAHEHK